MLSEQDRPGFIGVLWSLSIEEQFYLVWAVLVSFLPIKFIKYFLIVVIMISTGFRLLNDGNERVLYFHTFSVMSDLAIGGLAAYVSFNTASFCNFYNHLSRMSILAIYAIGLAFIFIIPTRFGVNPMNWVLRLALALFFAFVIAEQNYSQNSLIKMKKLKIVSWLGKITYGLYLLHMIALFAVTFFLFRVGLVATDMAYIVILAFGGFAVSVVISFLSYRFFESPFLRFKRYFAS
jgi:peptidoglycan/LPS O-acetylase OafA/YrhL